MRVRRPPAQDRMTSVVTLAGLYYGDVSPGTLLANRRLRISNNRDSLRIYSFTLTFFTQGDIDIFTQPADSLTDAIIAELGSRDLSRRTRVYIAPVMATNRRGDTLCLNPIDLLIAK